MKSVKFPKADQLKEQAQKLSSALHQVLNTKSDLAMREDRVYISQERLPGFKNTLFNGGARFDAKGNVRNLGVRHCNGGSESVELVVRSGRGRTSIVEKTYSNSRAETTVVTAVFNTSGRLMKFRESIER